MTVAYTCVFIAVLMPYLWTFFVKKDLVKAGAYDNNNPRQQQATLEGAALRASWAHANAFESLPGFIGAVIIAHLAGAAQNSIDLLAVAYVVCRLLYGICYIRDMASARSLMWGLGLLATIGLFVIAY